MNGFHNTSPKPPTLEEIDYIVAQLEPPDSTGEGVAISNSACTNEASQNGIVENGLPTNGAHQHAPSENGSLQNGNLGNGHLENGLNASNRLVINENGVSHESEISRVAPRLFVLSSFDEGGVKRNAMAYANYFKTIQPPNGPYEGHYLADLAYTMSNKRSIFPWRSYALASSLSELVESLSNEHGLSKAVRVRTQPKVAFVFTGQGAQWHAMGRELLTYSIFKNSLQDATAYMKSLGADWSLMEELLREKVDSKVNQPHLAHPSCVALQVALVDLLASWSLLPSRVVGHSSGEIGAAYCAGKLSREAAWKVSYFRGVISAKQFSVKGAMMAVGLSETDLQPYLNKVNDEIEGEVSFPRSPWLSYSEQQC
jgi:acyl transferase domain-containing protein